MIKKIINVLSEFNEVSSYKIECVTEESYQQFYVLHKFETARRISVTEYNVTVYHKFSSDGRDFLGSSTFKLSHNESKGEIRTLISSAIESCKLVKNPYFELVKPVCKKSFNQKDNVSDVFGCLNRIAEIYHSNCHDSIMINALELFYTIKKTRVINSLGVDLTKTLRSIFIEAIPSSHGEEKTEVYKQFTYSKFDEEQIKNDALNAINETIYRSKAVKYNGTPKCDVILAAYDLRQLIGDLCQEYNYGYVFKKQNTKSIGDSLCSDAVGDKLSITLSGDSKYDGFDSDGVLLHNLEVIKDNNVVSYFGGNQYAYYLGVEPTGNMSVANVKRGKTSYKDMNTKNTLDIISLSGIQIDMHADYIGGEIRLALYNDGNSTYPVTQLSFSGKLSEVLKDFKLSKETCSISRYNGPSYLKLKDLDIL